MLRTRNLLAVAATGLLTTTMLSTVTGTAQSAPQSSASSSGAASAQSTTNQATTVQMSVWTGGFTPGLGSNNRREKSAVSADGRYVAMAVSGPVVPGQPVLSWQIVRRDRVLGTTELISKNDAGQLGNAGSYHPSISADGQVIAFESRASNLVPGDTNGHEDVFVHDVRTGRTIRASADAAGNQVHHPDLGGTYIGPPSVSADGNWVGFVAKEKYTPDSSDEIQAYLRHVPTGAIEVVSRTATGAPSRAHVDTPVSISRDGSVVAYDSGGTLIRVVDRRTTPYTVKVIRHDKFASAHHSISADGTRVVFDSTARDLVDGDTNAASDVFVHHLPTGVTRRVSVSTSGAQANSGSDRGVISADGRYVSFSSRASNLVTGDTNGKADVFRHDLETGETTRVSLTAAGAQSTEGGEYPAISGDGQHVAFESYGKDLTPVGTHGYGQVFVRDLTGRYPALFARVRSLPARMFRNDTARVATLDIRTGPPLAITWTRPGGGVVRQSATVSGNAFTLRAPKKPGTYTLAVSYSGHELASRTVTVRRPTATTPKQARKNKAVTVKTAGIKRGQRVQVRFNPLKGTRGKRVNRSKKVNAKGVVKVKAPARAGRYRIVVRANKQVLRRATIRIR